MTVINIFWPSVWIASPECLDRHFVSLQLQKPNTTRLQ